mmetsp:Transcript_7244/g.20536  ORF Transcript_7244/g.20536 Transcript_7244/m.20536 type:complete len:85 (-) Transcript_7244:1266-1520(-)
MFMRRFSPAGLPDLDHMTDPESRFQQYDALPDLPPQTPAARAADVLLDGEAEAYQEPWYILRHMMADQTYRDNVLAAIAVRQDL